MVDVKETLKRLITKHKDITSNERLINDLCRLHFEIEEQENKKSPFEGSQLKETKDDVITEQSLLDLGFKRETSIIFEKKVTRYLTVIYNTHNKELSIYDDKISDTIVLDKIFTKQFELKNLLNSII